MNDRLFCQIIDFFPYPIAIFTPQYNITLVNRAFETEIRRYALDPVNEAIRILLYKITDMQLATGVTRVFAGDTFFLEDLKNPFAMFSGITKQSATQPDRFHKAVIFPLSADNKRITHGVIVFMP